MNTYRDFQISTLKTLEEGWYLKPTTYICNSRFRQQSYSHSAIGEINKYISEHPYFDPITCVENFAKMMSEYSTATKGEQSWMFSIYHDTAMDVLDMLLGRD